MQAEALSTSHHRHADWTLIDEHLVRVHLLHPRYLLPDAADGLVDVSNQVRVPHMSRREVHAAVVADPVLSAIVRVMDASLVVSNLLQGGKGSIAASTLHEGILARAVLVVRAEVIVHGHSEHKADLADMIPSQRLCIDEALGATRSGRGRMFDSEMLVQLVVFHESAATLADESP